MRSRNGYGKNLFLFILVVISLLTFQIGCDRNGQTDDEIEVVINEEKLSSDVEPIIVNNRAMLPMRAVFESLGAKVTWEEETQTVSAEKDDTEIELVVGENYALVNGERRWLDTPSLLEAGRTYVPIRFVGETLGMEVTWDSENRVVNIEDTPYEMVRSGKVTIEEIGLYIGQSESELIESVGNPERKDRAEKGFTWYIYNSDYDRYFQVGIEDDKVVAIYTNSEELNYDNKVYFEMPSAEVEKQFPERRSFFDNKYEINMDEEVLSVFIDVHKENTVTSVLLMEKSVSKRVPGRYSDEIKKGNELQLLDLANSVRVREDLEMLSWDEDISKVAREHSEDMAENNFFSHTNLDGESPFDRMERHGLSYWSAAENIAAGYPNSIYAHEAWMNSIDHREAILLEIERLGVGIAQNREGYLYYTENFYTPR